MLYFNRVDPSEGIYVNKTSASKDCDICHHWHFLNKHFKFLPNVCNKCHDFLRKSMNFRNIGILNIKSADYCCIISGIKTNEALNLIQNADLRGQNGTL